MSDRDWPEQRDPVSFFRDYGSEYRDWTLFLEHIAWGVLYRQPAWVRAEVDQDRALTPIYRLDHPAGLVIESTWNANTNTAVAITTRVVAALCRTWPAGPWDFDDWVTRALAVLDLSELNHDETEDLTHD